MKYSRREFINGASQVLAASAVVPHYAPADADEPLGIRRDFPAVGAGVYLNTAYIAPIPVQVVKAGRTFLEAKARRPISLSDMLAETHEVRKQFTAFVNADAEEIGFLYATTEGGNIIANALRLKPGENMVVDELHYEATYVLYKHLERMAGIQLRIARQRDGAGGVADFEQLVDQKTRLVSVAWVSHQNGFRHDMKALGDLAHSRGSYLYSDAVQAVGMFPIDTKAAGVVFFTAGTHKWPLAGYGIAPFFVLLNLLDLNPTDRRGVLPVQRDLGNYQYEIYKTAPSSNGRRWPLSRSINLGQDYLPDADRAGQDRPACNRFGARTPSWPSRSGIPPLHICRQRIFNCDFLFQQTRRGRSQGSRAREDSGHRPSSGTPDPCLSCFVQQQRRSAPASRRLFPLPLIECT